MKGTESRWQELSRKPWAWALGSAILVGGILLHLLQSAEWTWWIANAAFLPLVALAVLRAQRLGFLSRDSGGSGGDGPLTPP